MKTTLAIASAIAAIAAPSYAGTPDLEIAPAPAITPAASGWEFELTLYSPLMGMEGTTGIGGLYSDIDISFSEILDNLDGTFSGALTARYDRWSISGDLIWLKLSDAVNPTANSYLGVELQQYMGSVSLGYEVFRNDTTSLELVGGAAVTSLDIDLDLFTPRLPTTARFASGSETWIDPFVGLRFRHQLSDCWSIFATGIYGGFGVSSDEYWQALGGIAFRLTEHSSIALAYRAISVDYHDGGFLFDAKTSGPNLGLVFNF